MACVLGLGQQHSGTWGQGGPDTGGGRGWKVVGNLEWTPSWSPRPWDVNPNSATPCGPPRDGEPQALALYASCPECPKIKAEPDASRVGEPSDPGAAASAEGLRWARGHWNSKDTWPEICLQSAATQAFLTFCKVKVLADQKSQPGRPQRLDDVPSVHLRLTLAATPGSCS